MADKFRQSLDAAAEIDDVRAETALAASEMSYRAIFEAAEDAIFVHDWDTGAIVDVNPAACRRYGWSRAEMLQLSVADFSSNLASFTGETALRYIEAAKRGENVRFEWHRRNKDGSLHWDEVVLRAAVVGGRRHILAFTREISGRKLAEQALRASEARLRATVEASLDCVLVIDSEGRIVEFNPAAEGCFGYARATVLGQLLGDLLVPQRYREAHREGIARMQQSNSPRMLGRRVEMSALRADGSEFPCEVTITRVETEERPLYVGYLRDITDRKASEEALRAGEEQYRAIFEAATDSLQLIDAQHRVVDVNPAYECMYGRRREDVVGKTLDELVPTSLREERGALVARALAGEAAELLTTGLRGDGTPFDLEVRVIPFQHRGLPHVLGIARDITERRRTEQAIRASEEQYRAIFNASADALVLRDAEFRIIDVNATYERMSGWTRAEVLGTDRVIANPADVAPSIRALHSRALAGEPVELEVPLVRRDGTRYEIELRGVPIRHRGQPHVLYMGRDVTERKLAEAGLRASEEQYRAIFNASADAMLLRDESMRIVDANPAFLALCGLSRERVIGRADAPLVTKPYAAATLQVLRDALNGLPSRVEARTPTHDGANIDVEIRAMPMQYRGRPHVLSIARNITADKRAEAERKRYESRLRQAQKMEAIGQLTGGIAHDFNNILSSVMGYVVLAEERATDTGDSKSVNYLNQALGSCRRARDLIQQMLTFSRGGRGELRALSLTQVVQEALPMLRSVLPSSLAIDVMAEAEAPAVRFDDVQANQVLLNLAINARDAMANGGRLTIGVRHIRVQAATCASCRLAVDGSFVELSVSDSGGGIDDELLERIFDPFFTTKAAGKGSGMGLSMVHGIVHESGGHVLVDTTVGRGTTFRVVLPPHAVQTARDVPMPANRSARTPLHGRVLVVDDEPSVLAVLRERLTSWGLEVDACASAELAEQQFTQRSDGYDLVVTDHAMPLVSGIELAERLRLRHPRQRWLLCTGYADEASVARARALGALSILQKPVEAAELRAAIEMALPRV